MRDFDPADAGVKTHGRDSIYPAPINPREREAACMSLQSSELFPLDAYMQVIILGRPQRSVSLARRLSIHDPLLFSLSLATKLSNLNVRFGYNTTGHSESPNLTTHHTSPKIQILSAQRGRKPNFSSPMHLTKLLPLTTIIAPALAGPAAYGVCQTGCAAVAVACYGAAGAVMGVTCGAAATPAVLACNAAYGSCQAACWAALALPTL